jgi:hypothetical protein
VRHGVPIFKTAKAEYAELTIARGNAEGMLDPVFSLADDGQTGSSTKRI